MPEPDSVGRAPGGKRPRLDARVVTRWLGGGLRGQVRPAHAKSDSARSAIAPVPIPARLFLPLKQHAGAPASPQVAIGERVRAGQCLAKAAGRISAAVHAPVAGVVTGIVEVPAPHPSGLTTPMIVLDVLPELIGRPSIHDSGIDACVVDSLGRGEEELNLTPSEIAERVEQAGIVGMGGASFPTVVKLQGAQSHAIETVILNGSECEPYLSCDDRLMREQAPAILEGAAILARAVGARTVCVYIEANKPEAIAAMRAAAGLLAGEHRARGLTVRLETVPSRYPMGWERGLVTRLTGFEIPAGARANGLGVVVHNVATAFAIGRAVIHGLPLTARVVTVAGDCVRRPGNYWVPLGMPVSTVLAAAGGLREPPVQVLSGGPMMGLALASLDAPVVKGMNGVLALSAQEVRHTARPVEQCLRCGRCVDACPVGLVPSELFARIRSHDWQGAAERGLEDCLGCGACAYACPANRPLTQAFQHARGELAVRRRLEQRQDMARARSQARAQRLASRKRGRRAAPAQTAGEGDR